MTTSALPKFTELSASRAAAEERRRLARELHDSLGYALTISIVQLENATKLIGEEPQQAQALIEAVRGHLSSGLDDLRVTLTTLRNHEVCADNLLSSMQRLISEYAAATGIVVHTRLLKSLPALSDAQATTLYRTVQEALLNSHKHGQARNVQVSLDTDDSGLILSVKDDGTRLAPSFGGGFGLIGMKERADQLGGRFLVTRPPEGGVMVTLNLPHNGEVYA